VIMKSLETDPNDRYITALDFGKALAEAAESGDRARLLRYLQ
jgi:hypothetical protein